jgi:hypothetical protein
MFTINTYIRDIDSNEALPFASVVITDSKGKAMPINGVPVVGRKSDENGKLIIPIAIETAYITVSYVGYQSITHPADDYRDDTIYLKKKSTNVFGSGKDFVVKEKKTYPTTRPNPRPTTRPNIRPTSRPQPKAKPIAWYVYTSVAVGVVAIGLIIYKLAKN